MERTENRGVEHRFGCRFGNRLRENETAFAYHWQPFADLQAPVFYWIDSDKRNELGMNLYDASLWLIDHHMPKHLASYGGQPGDTITPWIFAIGYTAAPDRRYPSSLYTQPRELVRDTIDKLEGYGVREFLIWSDTSSQQLTYWNDFAKIVRDEPF